MGRKSAALFITLLVTILAGCQLPGRFMRGYARAEPQGMELLSENDAFGGAPSSLKRQVRFVFDDFRSLDTDNLRGYGSPWKLVGATLVRDRHASDGAAITRRTLDRIFEEYGFIRPTSVANWVGPQPRFELMGIAGSLGHDGVYRYPEGYEPWSRPALYDTREMGRSNAGHEFRRLTEAQKDALLEYLKVL